MTAILLSLLLALGPASPALSTHAALPDDSAVAAEAAPPPGEALGPWRRVAVIGASVSDGFGLGPEFGVDLDLTDVLAAALPEGSELLAVGSSQLFLQPSKIADEMLEKVLAFEPSLVVAVDFLFWFGYGFAFSEESRLVKFERGLERLERLPCPLVVGDVPDMRRALEGEGPFGPMLRPQQIPEPETLVELNDRLAEWADEREDVTVVSLADFTRRVASGEALELRGNRWTPADTEAFLQPDLLHPTVRGSVALVLAVLDRATAENPAWDVPALVWDAAALEERLVEQHAEELRAAEERERRREERKRRRAERVGGVR